MAKYNRIPKGKEIRPTFFVFCEGESEAAYVGFLKSHYRVPIEITSKIAGNRITQKYINNTLKNKATHEKDKTFLMYDLDAPKMLEKLQAIKNTIMLASNPCFELWYILHYCNHTSEIKTSDCIAKFERICQDYRKGEIKDKLKEKLIEKFDSAIKYAKKLQLYNNPSTSVYLLIEELVTTTKKAK